MPLKGNVLKPLVKSVLIPLGLKAAAAATTDAAIHKRVFGPGHSSDLASHVTTLTISNEEMDDIMKMVKSFEKSGLLTKVVSMTIKNEAKEKNGGFLGILLGTSGTLLLGDLLTGKGVIAMSQGQGTIRAGESTFRADEGTVRAGQDF